MNRPICLMMCLSLGVLCSCKHDKPVKKKEPPKLTSPAPEVHRAAPVTRPVAPPVVPMVPPAIAPEPSPSSSSPQGGASQGGSGAGGSSQGHDAGTAAPDAAGAALAPVSASESNSAGIGHVDPLGDPTKRLIAPEEKLEIPSAQAPKVASDEGQDQPVEEPQPKSQAAVVTPPAELPQMHFSSEDIERLPPERRAAVMRYLKTVQDQRAATQRSGGAK